MAASTYRHQQTAPLYLILVGAALAEVTLAWPAWYGAPIVSLVLVLAGVITFLGALSFKSLLVQDEGEHLALRFGPLPLFRRRIPYARITAVAAGRSSIIDGWGIHYVPGRGWTWNLWGLGCVVVRLGTGTLRIGTDDVAGLEAFLKTKVALPEAGRE